MRLATTTSMRLDGSSKDSPVCRRLTIEGSTLWSYDCSLLTARCSYEFLDESFDRQYKSDEQLAVVIGYFSLLAVIIACLGLFALSSFMVSRRRKEIGIRKSMGASVSTIYSMLSWDFLRWILVAVVIACPVAWYLMHLWLQTFAYHVSIGVDIFIISALLALAVALITITGQSLRAANANPIDSLRYE